MERRGVGEGLPAFLVALSFEHGSSADGALVFIAVCFCYQHTQKRNINT